MKIQGILGKGTGKLGSSVFAVSGGEQIVREYNPNVSNPNTEAQVAQRAKLKLMSQLAAALAPALGFAKQGLVSARNQFVSKNIGLCTYENDAAKVGVVSIKLTPSNVAFPLLIATPGEAGTFSVELDSSAAADVKRVTYFVFRQTENDKLEYVASQIITEAGEGRVFPTSFSNVSGDLVVYAYGIKDNNAQATMKYENYINEAGSADAALEVVSLFRSADYKLTTSMGALVEVE